MILSRKGLGEGVLGKGRMGQAKEWGEEKGEKGRERNGKEEKGRQKLEERISGKGIDMEVYGEGVGKRKNKWKG